jgi:hypothetical protein
MEGNMIKVHYIQYILKPTKTVKREEERGSHRKKNRVDKFDQGMSYAYMKISQ